MCFLKTKRSDSFLHCDGEAGKQNYNCISNSHLCGDSLTLLIALFELQAAVSGGLFYF